MAGTALQFPRKIRSCETKSKLAQEFATAARLYYEAAVQRILRDGIDDDDQLRKNLEQARQRAEAAHVAFDDHVDSHGC